MRALRRHWPEYAIEAALLGSFMVSACVFGTLLEHPASPLHRALPQAWLRRVAMGAAMGLTAIAIIYSPWGKRSGAHINPATTLTFVRLGRVPRVDALFYGAAQFAGAALGVLLASAWLGRWLADPHVRWVVTAPGAHGVLPAFAAETAMTFVLMWLVLCVSASRHARWTGVGVGCLVAAYIALLAPVSGMSLNPARTFGSSVVAHVWDAQWIYWTAPPLGMLLAAELYVRRRGAERVACAKLHHVNRQRCIFCAARAA
jgi:aquaporin Z